MSRENLGPIGLLMDLIEVEPWKEQDRTAMGYLCQAGFMERTADDGVDETFTMTEAGRGAYMLLQLALEQGMTLERFKRYKGSASYRHVGVTEQ